jgi:cytochrome c553
VTSNCAGNFYSGADNFKPAWPVWMKVEFGEWTAEMVSPSSREGSCAACHGDPASPSSVGHVYLVEDDAGFTQEGCE